MYRVRPTSCRNFQCAWLKGQMAEEHRPDLCGVMVEDYGKFMFAMCDGDEWLRMKDELDKYVMAGQPVVIGSLKGNHMILPSGMHPSQVVQLVQEAL